MATTPDMLMSRLAPMGGRIVRPASDGTWCLAACLRGQGEAAQARVFGLHGQPDGSWVLAGLTEGAEKTWIADLAPREERALAFGALAMVGALAGLAGNALCMAAARATLEHVLTDEAFAVMESRCSRLVDRARATIEATGVPWSVLERTVVARLPGQASV